MDAVICLDRDKWMLACLFIYLQTSKFPYLLYAVCCHEFESSLFFVLKKRRALFRTSYDIPCSMCGWMDRRQTFVFCQTRLTFWMHAHQSICMNEIKSTQSTPNWAMRKTIAILNTPSHMRLTMMYWWTLQGRSDAITYPNVLAEERLR